MSKKAARATFSAPLQPVTRPPSGKRCPPMQNDLVAQKARKLLRATYRNLKGKGGWRAVARHFGLKGPGHAMLMARGERPVCGRMRDAVKMNGKRFFRGFIRKVTIPFLEKRQTKSKSGRYGRGGIPL